MKRFLFAAAVAAATVAIPALAADVGVSLNIGQPGFYGRVDIGGYPQPQVIYRQPTMVERVDMGRAPIYLHVPPAHARHWSRHCREYNACGERVLFVRDSWYNREYAPRHRQQHRDRQDDRHDEHGRNGHRGDQNDHRGDDHDHGRDH